MKWLQIFKRAHYDEADAPTDEDLKKARQARIQAEKELKEVQRQKPEVERIAGRLREIRRTNHLAELFEASLRQRGDPKHG